MVSLCSYVRVCSRPHAWVCVCQRCSGPVGALRPLFPRCASPEPPWWRQGRGTGECPVQGSQVHFLSVRTEPGQCPAWGSELSLWPLSGLTSCSLSVSGYVADAAAGGAWGFRHRHRGGAQREGVRGEGLQSCGENHRVSPHISRFHCWYYVYIREWSAGLLD